MMKRALFPTTIMLPLIYWKIKYYNSGFHSVLPCTISKIQEEICFKISNLKFFLK